MRIFGADDGVRSDLSCGPGSEVADGRAHSRNSPACAVLCSGRCAVSLALVAAPSAPRGWLKVEVPR